MEEHCRKRGIEIVEAKREIFKEGVRRVWAWKKIEREQVVEWEVSGGHVSDFLNVMRQHGGGCSYGWRSGEASLMAYTSDERNWSPWKKELNNSKGGGKRESGAEGGNRMGAAGCRLAVEYTVFRGLEGECWSLTGQKLSITTSTTRAACAWQACQKNTLQVCQRLWSRGRIPGAVAVHRNLSRFVPR